VRALLTKPRWLALHAVVLAVAVVMVRLGSWQWGRASDSGRVQNYAYAAQWVLFALFTVVAYVKLARDEVRDDEDAPSADGGPEGLDLPLRSQPAAPATPEDDAELESYNAYLRSLAEKGT
jgi:DNA-binding transcriptional regulator of glucitol operon